MKKYRALIVFGAVWILLAIIVGIIAFHGGAFKTYKNADFSLQYPNNLKVRATAIPNNPDDKNAGTVHMFYANPDPKNPFQLPSVYAVSEPTTKASLPQTLDEQEGLGSDTKNAHLTASSIDGLAATKLTYEQTGDQFVRTDRNVEKYQAITNHTLYTLEFSYTRGNAQFKNQIPAMLKAFMIAGRNHEPQHD